MARIGRIQPAGSLVFIAKSLAHEDKTLSAELVSATAVAFDATVKVKPSAGTVAVASNVNPSTIAIKPKPGAVIGTAIGNDPVSGSFRIADADRAFVSTVAFDATVCIGPVAITATATGASGSIGPTVPAGTVNVTTTVNVPASFGVRFNSETVVAAAVLSNPSVSFLRMFQAGPVSAAATAYAQNKIILIPNPIGYAGVAASVFDVPNQGLAVFPPNIAPPAVAYQPTARIRGLSGAVEADADVFIGIFSPRAVVVSAAAYDVQFYLDTVDWRTREIEVESRVKVVDSESRTLTVDRRQLDTRAR